VLHRAAFGPREAGTRKPAAARASQGGNVVARATAWLRENL
jgi:hypothetical protein